MVEEGGGGGGGGVGVGWEEKRRSGEERGGERVRRFSFSQ